MGACARSQKVYVGGALEKLVSLRMKAPHAFGIQRGTTEPLAVFLRGGFDLADSSVHDGGIEVASHTE